MVNIEFINEEEGTVRKFFSSLKVCPYSDIPVSQESECVVFSDKGRR